MCHYRQVNLYYVSCGHSVPQPDERITCGDARCALSPNHGSACAPATCRQTCWQRLQYPQQYSPNISDYCPRCSQGR